jgi:hypothetical protein
MPHETRKTSAVIPITKPKEDELRPELREFLDACIVPALVRIVLEEIKPKGEN